MKYYNTLTRKTEAYYGIEKGAMKIYTCGLTVYSQPHIGNWVGYIYWDVLQRALMSLGVDVQRVQNITDVGHLVSDDDDGEDKMEKGARAEGKTAWEVAQKYIDIADDEAYNQLKLIRPQLVRATDMIPEQIKFVQELEDKGFTYIIPDNGVYFDTSKLNDYGKLARIDIDGLEAGSRVEFGGKKNVTDFALWKFSPAGQKRDMEWESPWGIGFPGWHLECSVIARESLGDSIDIHTGGIDHIPIHHTNEIAQTESLTGKQFVHIWLHNNHMKVDGKKMSKSLGNIYTLQDIKDKGYDEQAFKLLVLSKRYRTEGNFTWDILDAAQNRLNHWQAVADLRWQTKADPDGRNINDNIMEALIDDLDTPKALAAIDSYFTDLENVKDITAPDIRVLDMIDELLGIDLRLDDISDEQKAILQQRAAARDNKDWATSDELRDKLSDQGISVKDTPGLGQVWSRIKTT